MKNSEYYEYGICLVMLVAIILSWTGYFYTGFVAVLAACLALRGSAVEVSILNNYIFILLIPLIWALSLSKDGLNSIEFLTIIPVLVGSISLIQDTNKIILTTAQNSLIIFSISQLVLYCAFMGWVPELVISSVAIFGFWEGETNFQSPAYFACLFWSLYFSVYTLSIPLEGGIMNSNNYIIDTAHKQWIQILGSTTLGASIFYSALGALDMFIQIRDNQLDESKIL